MPLYAQHLCGENIHALVEAIIGEILVLDFSI